MFQACAPRYVYFSINKRRMEPVGTCFTAMDSFSRFSEYSPCRTGQEKKEYRISFQARYSVSSHISIAHIITFQLLGVTTDKDTARLALLLL